ncbi:MAG: hypothetical protein JZD41_05570 [Thermoproteus sp.]|nr:hypothetical protein [Thermoproteus sp.]
MIHANKNGTAESLKLRLSFKGKGDILEDVIPIFVVVGLIVGLVYTLAHIAAYFNFVISNTASAVVAFVFVGLVIVAVVGFFIYVIIVYH